MKKTYWWRIINIILWAVLFLWEYLAIRAYKVGLCVRNGNCIFQFNNYTDPFLFVFTGFFITSLFLFFVNDLVFKKWLKFAIAWFILTTILIILAPTSSTSIPGNPTKEDVSIWMSSLFVIISLIQIIYLSTRQKKGR